MSTYERTFTVSVPAARAWRAFTEPAELEIWLAERFESGGTDANSESLGGPGGPMHFAPTEVVPNERLAYRQWAESPEGGIDVTVVFEAIEHGTRITFTQVGFGDPTRFTTEPVNRGMDETLQDLVLWLEHGIAFPRHRDVRARAGLGADFARVPGGLGITRVEDGSFAGEVGMRPGDVLLQLGHGPVFDHGDVNFFTRDHEAGDEVDVVFARAGEVQRGRGRLGVVVPVAWTLPV
jgi:uncharacterized protein YndB with AHSA1/START domain